MGEQDGRQHGKAGVSGGRNWRSRRERKRAAKGAGNQAAARAERTDEHPNDALKYLIAIAGFTWISAAGHRRPNKAKTPRFG
ncbi:hypothetical protein ACFY5D_00795 [Paeniglutamicibacter sp. NPDC012692]|uniref:hypothetical protein n=1 Tax=Paeniglutamicibacter sp. NPDC012692 TaxID=3364388 RepID=UPI0036B3B176